MVSWEALIRSFGLFAGNGHIYLNQYRPEWRDQKRWDKGCQKRDLMEDFFDMEMMKMEVEEDTWLQVRILRDGGLIKGYRERKKRIWLELTG